LEIRGIPGDIVFEYGAGTINWLTRVFWTVSAASELSVMKSNSIIADAHRMSGSPISGQYFVSEWAGHALPALHHPK
jgi:hypothetical protein